jgi:hypothetical protein
MRFGFEAVGGLLAGLLASAIGATLTLGIAGLLLLTFRAVESQLNAAKE